MTLKWSEQMRRLSPSDDAWMAGLVCISRREIRNATLSVVALLLAASAGPTPHAATPVVVPRQAELSSGGTKVLNYTPWYIHTFEIEGPAGSGVRGGGPNVMPVHEDGSPSGGGAETCCTSFPRKWQPDLRLTVRWKVDKRQDGKTPGYWYKAENVRVPQYGQTTYGVWAVFLPGDRVRIMVTDGNHDGGNNPNNRPSDSDPYMAQGVLDDEWNRLYRDGGNAQ